MKRGKVSTLRALHSVSIYQLHSDFDSDLKKKGTKKLGQRKQ